MIAYTYDNSIISMRLWNCVGTYFSFKKNIQIVFIPVNPPSKPFTNAIQ